ncbi:MAG: S-layer homology domain-containing protein [Monoglobus pectinilyticus]|uniref:S-layer homology domain-containing protein n=1 Tax=Monoglobus pectinilyticus TaxID=1981510 RepID=UPI0039A333ED
MTVLGRADNAESESSSPFSDVNTNGITLRMSLGAENGIVSGYEDGTFRPDNITREEMAEIFMNYYDYKGEGLTGDWAIQLTYSDISDISGWAVDGIMFCTIKGVQDKENNMTTRRNATRAETTVS